MLRLQPILIVLTLLILGCSQKSAENLPSSTSPRADESQTELAAPDPLAPSQWSLGPGIVNLNASSPGATYGELLRTAAGLSVKTNAALGRYHLVHQRGFEDNLDILLQLKPWTQEELTSSGITEITETAPLLRLITDNRRGDATILPKSLFQQSQYEIRIRISGGRIAVNLPETPRRIFARENSLPIKLCLDLGHNCGLTISKLEISEDIPFDEELAAAPLTQNSGSSGTLPPGFMAGGPTGFGPGGFGPGGPPRGNPNSEIVVNYKLFPPPQTSALKTIGQWYIPQDNEKNNTDILKQFQADDRGSSITVTKTTGGDGFWIVRKFEPVASMNYECRITVPSWEELHGIAYDRSTLLAANIFPAKFAETKGQNDTDMNADHQPVPQEVQCPALPGPIPNLPREATLHVSRQGDQATLRIDGTSSTVTIPSDEPLLLGVFMRGAVRFTLVDTTQDGELAQTPNADEQSTPNDSKSKVEPRSLADVISSAEASVVRIETSGDDGRGIGSGFVVDDKGTLITNCHVLSGATSAKAVFSDGKSCKILGVTHVDQARDIVVAKIDQVDRPKIELTKAVPRKGDEVIALGTPHGLDFTATRGIVSAIRQAAELPEEKGLTREGVWIQIDAPLSPGNSGGPLIDNDGKVIAMSTLASRGSAQNLNFGISADDISNAIILAANLPTQPLADSTAKIKYPEDGQSGPSDSNTAHFVPEEPVQRYIDNCKQNFAKYVRELREEISVLGAALKEMEKGQVPVPTEINSNAPFVKVITPQKKVVWFFRNTAIKVALIEHTEERLDALTEIRSKIKSNRDASSLKNLALNYGPKLDARKNHEVGFISEAVVIRAINDHEVAVDIDGVPYLIWLESTVGLGSGELILPCAVYVDGTVTLDTAQYGSRAVTLLRQVPVTQFEEVIQKVLEESQKNAPNTPDDIPANKSLRTWVDTTGKYKIEAELVSNKEGKVTLKRRDGTTITLPIDKLSAQDREYLDSLN